MLRVVDEMQRIIDADLYRPQLDLADRQVAPTLAEKFDAVVLIEADELSHRSKHLPIIAAY